MRKRSLIPNSSPFSRSTRFPFTYRFAARVPCDSKGSECQCGIHRAEAASALRSRKTERAAKEKPTPISQIFFSTCCARWGTGIQHVSSRSEEHTSELQSLAYLVCRLLLEKKKKEYMQY